MHVDPAMRFLCHHHDVIPRMRSVQGRNGKSVGEMKIRIVNQAKKKFTSSRKKFLKIFLLLKVNDRII